jgi:hypothetical protein
MNKIIDSLLMEKGSGMSTGGGGKWDSAEPGFYSITHPWRVGWRGSTLLLSPGFSVGESPVYGAGAPANECGSFALIWIGSFCILTYNL